MNYTIIIRPLIGAGIGYVTNWIAVKMLFRPLKPIKIGKWTLPFTPGIIPRNRERMSESIGKAICDYLLTEEVLTESLLSSEAEDLIRKKVTEVFSQLAENEETVEESICQLMEKSSYEKAINWITITLTKRIIEAIQKANLGDLVAEQMEVAAKEKLKGSMLGKKLFRRNYHKL